MSKMRKDQYIFLYRQLSQMLELSDEEEKKLKDLSKKITRN